MLSLPWNWRPKQAPARRRPKPRPQLERLEDRLQPSIVAASPSDQKINTSTPLNQTLPSVAMDANGDFVVAWSNQTQPGPNYLYDVDARVYNAAGQAQTGEIVVAQTTGGTNPSVAMDANGDFVVSWQVLNASTGLYLYGISAQRYNLAGAPQGGTIVLNSGATNATAGEAPKVAMDTAGDFAITYQGYDANSHGIFAERFNSSGVSQGSGIFPVNTVTTGNQGAPTIAMDSAGDFVIAWEDGGQAQPAGIYAQRYNSSGVVQGGNTAISTVASGSTSPANPSVAMEPTGQYAIAWQFNQTASGVGNGFQGVETQRFSATGTALTSVIQLNTPENYNQGNASVAIDSEGDFVVAWESYGQGGTMATINTLLAQRVNSGGTLIGPTQFLPSTQTGDNQRFPALASDPNGNTMMVWESKPSPSSGDQNVFGRLYDYVNDAPTINTLTNVSINENAGQQTVNLTGIAAGGGETQTLTVTASSNNVALINPSVTYTSPNSTGSLSFTPVPNVFGTATITVKVTDNGGTLNGGVDSTSVQFMVTVSQVSSTVSGTVGVNWGTSGTATLQTAADGLRLLAAGRSTDSPWRGINKLNITLSSPAVLHSSDVSVTGINVANYGPVTISGSGTSYTITLAQAINTADRVTVTIGNANITTFTRRLDVLPGDINDDGVVNAQDAVLARNAFMALGTAPPMLFADINGDGIVDVNDYNLVRQLIGTMLPSLGPTVFFMSMPSTNVVFDGTPISPPLAPTVFFMFMS